MNNKKEGDNAQRGEQNLPKGDNGKRGDLNQAKQVWLITCNRFYILDKGEEGEIIQKERVEGKMSLNKWVEGNFQQNKEGVKQRTEKRGTR